MGCGSIWRWTCPTRFTAATCATLLKGVQILKKTQGTPTGEDRAGRRPRIDSSGGTLDGELLLDGQRVCQPADLAAVSVGGEVIEFEADGKCGGAEAPPLPFMDRLKFGEMHDEG